MIHYRQIEWPDIPKILELGERMHKESPFFGQYEFDRDEVTNYIAHSLNNPQYEFNLVAEKDGEIIGGMLGTVSKLTFCKHYMPNELIVYVEPEHRKGTVGIKLIKAFEKWAYEKGFTSTSIGFSTGINTDRTIGLYERLGYNIMSYKLVKELDNG